MAQLTNVCFTYNNPSSPIIFNEEKMLYLVYQMEMGANNTPHYQGYCEFKSRTRFNAIKELLAGVGGSCHIEARRGTQAQAIAYCKKDDTRVIGFEIKEFGTPKVTAPGKRNDIKEFRDAVMNGDRKRKREIEEEFSSIICRYPKYYDTLRGMSRPIRTEDLKVVLIIGPPGTGKTRVVYDRYKNDMDELWECPISNGTIWFDTYDLHKYVLLDDFAGASNHVTLTNLLRIIDRYPVQVPSKGAHTWWCPNVIFITTNIQPKDWYKWEGREIQYVSLARRFTFVYEMEDVHDPAVGLDITPPTRQHALEWFRDNGPEACIPFFTNVGLIL